MKILAAQLKEKMLEQVQLFLGKLVRSAIQLDVRFLSGGKFFLWTTEERCESCPKEQGRPSHFEYIKCAMRTCQYVI